jgi:hypothetical protein
MHLAKDYDADMHLEELLQTSTQKGGGNAGENTSQKPHGEALKGQPASKATGNTYIKLAKEESLRATKKFSSAKEAHELLKQEWGEEVELGELGENNFSDKDGWEDLHPVEESEYDDVHNKLDSNPEGEATFEMLASMYKRDPRAIRNMVEYVKMGNKVSPTARRVVVNALQAAGDHQAAQEELAKLLTTPGFEQLAAVSAHNIDNPGKKLMTALEHSAFNPEATDKVRCASMLALGALINEKQGSEAHRVASRITSAALRNVRKNEDNTNTFGNRHCLTNALQNAACFAGKHSRKILTAITKAHSWDNQRELIQALTNLPGKHIDNYLAKTFSNDGASEEHKLLAAMTLAKRQGGSDTEAAIGKVADSVEQLGESSKLSHVTKQVFAERLKEFHSPAAMRLMLVHHKKSRVPLTGGPRPMPAANLGEGQPLAPPKKPCTSASGVCGKDSTKTTKLLDALGPVKLNDKINLEKCIDVDASVSGGVTAGGTTIINCQRGLRSCVHDKLGCIGAGAFAFAYYNIDKEKLIAEAKAAAGVHLEFFKWGLKLFDTSNHFMVDGCNLKGLVNVKAQYFNFKKLQNVIIYANKTEGGAEQTFGQPMNNCQANQIAMKVHEKFLKSQVFFEAEMCYGIPKIAAICGKVVLIGSLGLTIGAALAMPTLDTLVFNAIPRAAITLKVGIEGTVAVLKGTATAAVVLVDATVPVSVPIKFREQTPPGATGFCPLKNIKVTFGAGLYLGWTASVVKGKMTAAVKGPGMNGWIPCASCKTYYSATLFTVPGIGIGGTILEKNIAGIKCAGTPGTKFNPSWVPPPPSATTRRRRMDGRL